MPDVWEVEAPETYSGNAVYRIRNKVTGEFVVVPVRQDHKGLTVGTYTWAARVARGLAAQLNGDAPGIRQRETA